MGPSFPRPPSSVASYLLYLSNCRPLEISSTAYVTHLIDLSYAFSFVSLLSSPQHSTPPPEARLLRAPESQHTLTRPSRTLHATCSHEDTHTPSRWPLKLTATCPMLPTARPSSSTSSTTLSRATAFTPSRPTNSASAPSRPPTRPTRPSPDPSSPTSPSPTPTSRPTFPVPTPLATRPSTPSTSVSPS